MNVDRETFLKIVSDKEAGGIIYDAFARLTTQLDEMHFFITSRPAECDKRYLKLTHAIYIGIAVVFLLIGVGLLQIETIASLIP